ncbi:MAG TPA: hypothetical protein VH593_09210 [Ktedonobacteraceae bacterium]
MSNQAIMNLSPNSTCRMLGHRWQKTTSDLYRRCDRIGCKAAERLSNDTWIPVEQRKRPRKQQTLLEPATLF